MTPEERRRDSIAFAEIVLGAKVVDEPPSVDTELGALNAIATEWERWGWPPEL